MTSGKSLALLGSSFFTHKDGVPLRSASTSKEGEICKVSLSTDPWPPCPVESIIMIGQEEIPKLAPSSSGKVFNFSPSPFLPQLSSCQTCTNCTLDSLKKKKILPPSTFPDGPSQRAACCHLSVVGINYLSPGWERHILPRAAPTDVDIKQVGCLLPTYHEDQPGAHRGLAGGGGWDIQTVP